MASTAAEKKQGEEVYPVLQCINHKSPSGIPAYSILVHQNPLLVTSPQLWPVSESTEISWAHAGISGTVM